MSGQADESVTITGPSVAAVAFFFFLLGTDDDGLGASSWAPSITFGVFAAELDAGGTVPDCCAVTDCPGLGCKLDGVEAAGDAVNVFFLKSQAFTDGGGAVGLVEGAAGGVTFSACSAVLSFGFARQLPSSSLSATLVVSLVATVTDEAVSAVRAGEAALADPLDPFAGGVDVSAGLALQPAGLGVWEGALVEGPAVEVEIEVEVAVEGVLVAGGVGETLPHAGLLLEVERTRSVLPTDVAEVDGFGLELDEPASGLRLLLDPLRFFSSSSLSLESLLSFAGRSRQFLDAFACDFFSLWLLWLSSAFFCRWRGCCTVSHTSSSSRGAEASFLLSGLAVLEALADLVELAAGAALIGGVVMLNEDEPGRLDSGGWGDVPFGGAAMILPLASLILSAYEPRALKTDVFCGGFFAVVLGISLLRGVRLGEIKGAVREGKDDKDGGDCTAAMDGIEEDWWWCKDKEGKNASALLM